MRKARRDEDARGREWKKEGMEEREVGREEGRRGRGSGRRRGIHRLRWERKVEKRKRKREDGGRDHMTAVKTQCYHYNN